MNEIPTFGIIIIIVVAVLHKSYIIGFFVCSETMGFSTHIFSD